MTRWRVNTTNGSPSEAALVHQHIGFGAYKAGRSIRDAGGMGNELRELLLSAMHQHLRGFGSAPHPRRATTTSEAIGRVPVALASLVQSEAGPREADGCHGQQDDAERNERERLGVMELLGSTGVDGLPGDPGDRAECRCCHSHTPFLC